MTMIISSEASLLTVELLWYLTISTETGCGLFNLMVPLNLRILGPNDVIVAHIIRDLVKEDGQL